MRPQEDWPGFPNNDSALERDDNSRNINWPDTSPDTGTENKDRGREKPPGFPEPSTDLSIPGRGDRGEDIHQQ